MDYDVFQCTYTRLIGIVEEITLSSVFSNFAKNAFGGELTENLYLLWYQTHFFSFN